MPLKTDITGDTAKILDRLVKNAGLPYLENDPLRFPHQYADDADREISAFFAALLAWGKRSIILAKLSDLLHRMGPSPANFVNKYTVKNGDLGVLKGFVHRTYTDRDIAGLALAVKDAYKKFGNLEGLFAEGIRRSSNDDPLKDGMIFMVDYLKTAARKRGYPLVVNMLPDPAKGSACKRLNLFLRWMVRKGEYDLGLWKCIGPESLIVPLDVRVGRAAKCLGLTQRSSQDWRTAVEITEGLRAFDSKDPTRFDFALSQLQCEADLNGKGCKDCLFHPRK